jgi:thiol-disulfide isomerase/thioredoxin
VRRVQRVWFLGGAAALLTAVPIAGPAVDEPARKPKGHVHGANGVVRIPEGRPLEMTMPVLDGPDFQLSAYAGKVVFLNVFATWCGPCRAEQPALSTFAKTHAADTTVIGLNYREEDNDVRQYRKDFEIAYPIAMDRTGRIVPSIYTGQMAFPMTLVVRPDRTLFCAWRGDRSRAWFEREREAALASATES